MKAQQVINWCPKCGARMRRIEPDEKRGQDFDPFWGCTQWPDCDGTREIASDGDADYPEADASLIDNLT